MGSSRLWRHSALRILVCTLALGVALPLLAEGDLPSSNQEETGDSSPSGPGEAGPSEIPVCGAGSGGEAGGKLLKLDGKDGLQFKCADSETLGPPELASEPPNSVPKQYIKVYEYNGDGACKKTAGETRTLVSVVPGATLTESTEASGGEGLGQVRKGGQPVYTLKYSENPEAEQLLCYTCNKASGPASALVSNSDATPCAVLIKVPGKTRPPAQNISTAPPSSTSLSSTSGGPRIAVGVTAVAVTFLGVVLLL